MIITTLIWAIITVIMALIAIVELIIWSIIILVLTLIGVMFNKPIIWARSKFKRKKNAKK